MCGSCGSIARPEQPVLPLTNRTCFQVLPPSSVRHTPRDFCGRVPVPSADEDILRIVRVDRDAGDQPRVGQSHMSPGPTAVAGLVGPVARGDGVADDPRLARAGPDDGMITGIDCQGTDGLDRLLVEDRLELVAAIGRFPHAAGGRADTVDVGVARDAENSARAVAAIRADEAEPQRLKFLGNDTVSSGCRRHTGYRQQGLRNERFRRRGGIQFGHSFGAF